ncbi:MAG: nitroreductase family protein [Candidatus Aenigmatarchaeota archaeon]
MDVIDAIKKRRSIRKYKDRSVPKNIMNSILDAARYAPTARNMQELDYKIITSKSLMQKISDRIRVLQEKESLSIQTKDSSNLFHGAPLLIIITGPVDNKWTYIDAAIAAETIMLYATSIGLGTCFIGTARFIDKDTELLNELHILEGNRVAATVACGYPDEVPAEKERKLNAEFFE